jgi:DNA topoisomerase I
MPPKGKSQPAPKRKRPLTEEVDQDEDTGDEKSSNDSGSDNDDDDNDDDDNDSDNDNDDGSNDSSNDGSDDSSSDKEEDDEEENEEPVKKKSKTAAPAKKKTSKKADKKTAKKAKKVVKKKKVKTEAGSSSSADAKEKKVPKSKSLRKSERLEEARKAYKWWEAPKLENGVNWIHLEHAGICFAPPYVPHGVPLHYNGEPVTLTPPQEEIASFFAAIPADGPQLGNPKTKPVFEKNFFEDFKEALGPSHRIKKFELCDFSHIRAHLETLKSLRKTATDEEKAVKKAEKEEVLLKYGYALIDGRVEKVKFYLVLHR